MPKLLLVAAFMIAAAFLAPAASAAEPGDLIKLADDGDLETQVDSALYYYGSDGNRYSFPNEKVYFSWYEDFSAVTIVSAEEMASLPLGGNVTYRPGIRMVKIQTDPKTYAVMPGGILRWVTEESVAVSLYGSAWNTMIDDVADTFFTNYRIGEPIAEGDAYAAAQASAYAPTIGVDKSFDPPPAGVVFVRDNGFAPSSVTVQLGSAVTWVNVSSTTVMVASNDHPTHQQLPGFESSTFEVGQEYRYTFEEAGTHGYHNHVQPNQTGAVTVQ